MYKKILVPVDGAAFGEHALPWALTLARKGQGEVELLHVHTALQAAYSEIQLFDSTLDEQLRQREQSYLEHLQQRIGAAGVRATWANLQGEIAHTIRVESAQRGADLIVMSTHARGPMGRFWLGSVTDELIRDRALVIPLLLVHPDEKPVDLRQEPRVQSILVPLDGTPLAEKALDSVADLARLLNSKLTLLRITTPVIPMSVPAGLGAFGHVATDVLDRVQEVHEQLRREAQDYLEGVAQKLRGQGFLVDTHVSSFDQPGLGILSFAKDHAVDLIAMETHGRRGLARLLVGSVANKVLRGTTLPLLVHRAKE